MRIFLDFETRSAVDLRKQGLARYALDPSTDIMCYAYAIDDGPVVSIAPRDGVLPPPPHCEDAEIVAHNAQFEFALWNSVATRRYGWPKLRLEQLTCTMARCYAMGLPGALDNAAPALGLPLRKDYEGYSLMLKMCRYSDEMVSCEPQWAAWLLKLMNYCAQDVEMERGIYKRTLALSATEHAVWQLDQRINMRGVPFDIDTVRAALELADIEKERLNREMAQVTEGAVQTASNVGAIKEWASDYGVVADSLARYLIDELLKIEGLPEPVARVLELRREASRFTSLAKLRAILDREIVGRVQYMFQYHAASTGRWAGRGVQPHNFIRELPKPAQVEVVFDAVRGKRPDIIEMFDPVAAMISKCLRALIKAPKGRKLLGGDFSSIEGRGTAWIAGEQWKIDAFAANRDMYIETYRRAFGIDITKEDGRRQVGKVMELAFGYQGGVGAFQSMAKNYNVHVTDARADELKRGWRAAHPHIENFWHEIENAAKRAVYANGAPISCGRITFLKRGSFLLARLPSGRVLTYAYPAIREGGFGPQLTYFAVPDDIKWATYQRLKEAGEPNTTNIVDDARNSKQWARISTYGGSLTENVVQALCRDILAEAMRRMDAAGLPVVLHVHDEIICEDDGTHLDLFKKLMVEQPAWADGFPIAAGGWCAERYRKE